GSSIFVHHEAAAEVTQLTADATLDAWTSVGTIPRKDARLAATGTHVYLAGGTVGTARTADVFYAALTGPRALGEWKPASPLPAVAGPRFDTTLVASGSSVYLVGGEPSGGATDSVLYATL